MLSQDCLFLFTTVFLRFIHVYKCNVARMLSLQLCPTLCDPMDYSPPGSSVHGIVQARMLEWVAMTSSRGSSRPGIQTLISYVSCIGRWILNH